MRPRGTFGGVARAMLDAADAGPGSVRCLAHRAQVGYTAARYTASRLVSVGELVVLDDSSRPAVLGRAANADVLAAAGPSPADAVAELEAAMASFWER